MKSRKCSFSLKAVSPDTVSKIIKSMKSSKTCGLDNIDSYIIKLALNEILPAVTHIVNLSIIQKRFPSSHKCAKVVPLHKKLNKLDPKNYRPVALLPILSKIIEKAIFLQTIEYLEENNLLHPSHHGFRNCHNTATAILQMYDQWINAQDKGEISAVVMLDMSAAFDLVDSTILLDKMKIYGFDDNSLKWFQSYLTGRSQVVYIDGHLSDPLPVEIGVPQGSILGPLLYILYSNDLPEAIHNHPPSSGFYNIECKACGGTCCYADDSTYTFSHKDPAVIEEKIESQYQNITRYMQNNKLVLNSDKTHLLITTTEHKHKSHNDFNIKLNTGSEIIEPDKSEKILGGIISNDLKWKENPRDNPKESMIKCLSTRLKALAKISHIASFKTRKMIANGIFLSKLIYLIQVWGGTSEFLLSSLQILQNKAARYVTRLSWYTPIKILLNQCGWLTVRQLAVYHSLNLIYKTKRDEKPVYFHLKFSEHFLYTTRFACGNKIKFEMNVKKKLTEQNFTYKTIKIWNDLPIEIRQAETLTDFKNQVKVWIKLNIQI